MIIPSGYGLDFTVSLVVGEIGDRTHPDGPGRAATDIARAVKKAAIEAAKIARKKHTVKIKLDFDGEGGVLSKEIPD